MEISVKTSVGTYKVITGRGILSEAAKYMNLNRKVLIVTDSGVPCEYSREIASQAKEPYVYTVEQGEGSKSFDSYKAILEEATKNGFTRTDCIVAVGGGVVGDLAGFVASTYMRGIDFYNVPTTVLSQVDSSVGGKTAIDFMGIKNIVGAFYPPKAVIADHATIATLPQRHISNGLAEAVKMALTCDKELFEFIEKCDVSCPEVLDEIIRRSIEIKKSVVEADEREGGLRRVLNFGHTLAHGLENVFSMDTYFHGECVVLGMLAMCSPSVRERLIPVLKAMSLPTEVDADAEGIIAACRHDKKASGENITVVYVSEIGKFEFKTLPFEEYEKIIREVFGK